MRAGGHVGRAVIVADAIGFGPLGVTTVTGSRVLRNEINGQYATILEMALSCTRSVLLLTFNFGE